MADPYILFHNSRGQRIGIKPLTQTPAGRRAERLARLEAQVAAERRQLQLAPRR